MTLEKRQLSNGLTLYNDHIDSARTNHVRMYVPYGSTNERLGQEGVAHVFEHAVFLQTDMFEDEQELDRYADINGMQTNASTSYTNTDYYANGIGLEPNMVYLSQLLQHTHFPADKVKHELKAVRREMKSCLDDLSEMHDLAATNAMFGLPYGRSIGGYHDKINFSADTLKELHNKYYKLGQMSLIVTGKAYTDEVAELAEKYFSADTDSTFINEPLPQPQLGEARRTGYIDKTSSSAYLSVRHPLTPEFLHKIKSNLLVYGMAENAMSTAAYSLLRQDKGLSYDGSIDFSFIHQNASVFGGDVTVDDNKVEAAIEVFDGLFTRDSSQYETKLLLGVAANYSYRYNESYNSNSGRMSRIVQALSEDSEVRDIDGSMKALERITIPDIRAAIDDLVEYTNTHPRYVHVSGTKKAVGKADRIITQSEIA